MIEGLIEQSLVWKIGQPNNKIRKASIFCLQNLIQRQLVEKKILLSRFEKLKPLLQSCSEDDRASDLRFCTTVLFSDFLKYLTEEITRDQLVEFYVQVIARLDDA